METVGDAYIVVGGLPERTSTHAFRVANQALDMQDATELVTNPRAGEGHVKVQYHTMLFNISCFLDLDVLICSL